MKMKGILKISLPYENPNYTNLSKKGIHCPLVTMKSHGDSMKDPGLGLLCGDGRQGRF